ncbi:MAG: CotH kinase family protein [Bacteroidales bacterium]
MSSNISVIHDEDGAYSDWVELFNSLDTPVQLEGFRLTDDSLLPDRWVFPAMSIPAGGYLLVYCSGKDRVPKDIVYETIIRRGDTWRYRLGDSEPPAGWNSAGFDDSGWPEGASGFGYGDGDDETIVDRTMSLYTRTSFWVEDTSVVISAILSIDFDDAFVAYLNGKEIARSHIGIPGNPPEYDEPGEYHEAGMYRGLDPEQFEVSTKDLAEGSNTLAIQVHNSELESSDLTLIPYFTLVLDDLPDIPLGSPPELDFPGSELHSSFKLSADGEILILSDSSGNVIDSTRFGKIPGDISYGREPGSEDQWLYFEQPTPGGPNNTDGIRFIAEGEVIFSPAVKFFDGSLTVSLSSDQSEGTIRYTLDGSEPDETDPEFPGSVEISSTTTIRAKLFREGQLTGQTFSYNYIDRDEIEADNFAVICISTDADNLWNEQDGLFIHAENRELEKPAHVEFIEPDGSVGFSIDAGLKIFGNEPSGGDHQHKLSIFARSKYGYGSIDYHIFPDKPIEEFESIILRNAVPEMWDALASRLIDNEAVAKQSYRATVVFINGEYWGTKFLREKINEHFVADNFGVDPDSVDLIMGIESMVEYYNEEWPIAGDLEDYKQLIHYLIDHDLSDTANYEYIKTRIDIRNFITYQASEIYFGNMDWPGNNMKWWRERNKNGIWRWILFDVDAGLGAWEPYTYNSMLHATKPDHDGQWPNPPWSSFIFRKLLENQSFRDRFVLRSFDLLNTDFTKESVNREIDAIVRDTEGEIRNHFRRWGGNYSEWESWIEDTRYFAKYRAARVRVHIRKFFDLGMIRSLDLDYTPHGGGQVRVNSKLIEQFPWKGKYPEDLPVSLEAIPAYGYRFAGWEGTEDTSRAITVQLDGSKDLTAIFKPEAWYRPVIINEINYHSSPELNSEDWIELYNNGPETVSIGNWMLKDSDDTHVFTFPVYQELASGEYLVICRDLNIFHSIYPDVDNYSGNLGYGLSGGGEIIRLFSNKGDLVDWVEYDDFTPWPVEPDGKGATLALSHPDLDNSVARNWFASHKGGTPGRANSMFTSTRRPLRVPGIEISEPWPNPFSDQTSISYNLKKSCTVKIAVYNLQGQLVEILVDEKMVPGDYNVTWSSSNHSPGIYFCVVRAGLVSHARKLILFGN